MNKTARDKEAWHFRGREARGLGKPRALVDARVSLENRQAWLGGWDTEEKMRAPKPSEAQVTTFNTFLAELAASVRKDIQP